jgi:lipid-binding SYLF domain-containing protein
MHKSALLATSLLLLCVSAFAKDELKDMSETIGAFQSNATTGAYFGSAYGYAIFPTIGKGGIGIGAAHGSGQTYVGDSVTGFTSMTQVTIGLQLGGQAYSQVIFFENKTAYDNFTSGNFEFDAQASAIAITASAQASAGTTGSSASAGTGGSAGKQAGATYRKGMQTFVIGKGGLMYEASIGGQKFKFDPVGAD